jgi:hypothetical protein
MASIEKRLKRGTIREDGKVFWKYAPNYPNNEKWVTKERFASYKKYEADYRANNSEKLKNLWDNWYKTNKSHAIKSSSERILKRRKTDKFFKFKDGIRLRILCSIRRMGYTKKSKTLEILGCTWEFFKSYIEQRFKEGMSWENHGKWHFDHIVPISSAKSEKDVIKLNHYTNLRPLWAKDNLSKKDKVDTQLQISL